MAAGRRSGTDGGCGMVAADGMAERRSRIWGGGRGFVAAERRRLLCRVWGGWGIWGRRSARPDYIWRCILPKYPHRFLCGMQCCAQTDGAKS